MTPIIVLGAGGHAQELYGLAQACMQRVSGFVDETGSRDELFGLPVYHSIPNSDSFLCGVGNPFVKEQFEIKVDNELCEALIHPTVSMYYECYIEPGVTIGAHCTLTANIIIGRSASINSNCVISHDCRIGKRCHISGGTVLSGNVTLEDNVYVGAGARFLPGVHIGEGAVVGAGAVITKDVDPYTIVAGCPARVLRTYKRGDKVRL